MRAADLARELDLPANQMSFHLRQLAKYGLVEEDPDAARDKRDRVWRPTSAGRRLDQPHRAREAARRQGRVGGVPPARRGWGHLVVDAAYSDDRDPGILRTVNENAVRLTREEAVEMAGELDEVLTRWAEKTRGPRRRPAHLPAVLDAPAVPGHPGDPGLMAARLRPPTRRTSPPRSPGRRRRLGPATCGC